MAATLIPSPAPGLPHSLQLGPADRADAAITAVTDALGDGGSMAGPLRLCCGSWALRLPQLRSIATLVESRGLCLREVDGDDPETLVAAAALGLVSSPPLPAASHGPAEATAADGLTILRRTLRSGDQVDSKGSLLVLGDVNPGAQVSAVGHVLVWGRLRGVAHAGCDGDAGARIVALQLRPVQLRIAGAVARGPEGVPPAGLAEQALLVDGEIRIEAADPLWPLDN